MRLVKVNLRASVRHFICWLLRWFAPVSITGCAGTSVCDAIRDVLFFSSPSAFRSARRRSSRVHGAQTKNTWLGCRCRRAVITERQFACRYNGSVVRACASDFLDIDFVHIWPPTKASRIYYGACHLFLLSFVWNLLSLRHSGVAWILYTHTHAYTHTRTRYVWAWACQHRQPLSITSVLDRNNRITWCKGGNNKLRFLFLFFEHEFDTWSKEQPD